MNSSVKKGNIYWYRIKGEKYGAIVLDYNSKLGLFFIAISDELKCNDSPTVECILNAKVYTASWFDHFSILGLNRLHKIGCYPLDENSYQHNTGLTILENGGFQITNVGQSHTWKHQYKGLTIRPESIMSDLLSPSFF